MSWSHLKRHQFKPKYAEPPLIAYFVLILLLAMCLLEIHAHVIERF